MRKVILSPKDFDLFDNDVTFAEFEFFHKHWDAFRRMWKEQGQRFWIKFIITFRTFATDYGVIKEIPQLSENFLSLIDSTFIFLHEQFIESKYRGGKNLIDQILVLAQHKGMIHFLQQKSFSKDPFYNKDTRDCFRFLFGPPTEKISYIKAYILHDLYTKFCGAVCKCLKRWLNAEEVDSNDESFWNTSEVTPGKNIVTPKIEICCYCKIRLGEEPSRIFSENVFVSFLREKRNGQPCGPWFLPGWPLHEDPRFFDPNNPLYDLNSDPESDWRTQVDFSKYERLMKFAKKFYPSPEVTIEPDPAANADEDTIAMMKGMFEAGIGENVFDNLANKRGMGIDNVVKMFEIQDNLKQVKERQKQEDLESEEIVKTFDFDVTEFVKNKAPYGLGKTPVDQKDMAEVWKTELAKQIASDAEKDMKNITSSIQNKGRKKKGKKARTQIKPASAVADDTTVSPQVCQEVTDGEITHYANGNQLEVQEQVEKMLQEMMVMGKGTINIKMKANNPDGTPRKNFLSKLDEQTQVRSLGTLNLPGTNPEKSLDFNSLSHTLADLLDALMRDQVEHDATTPSTVNISLTKTEPEKKKSFRTLLEESTPNSTPLEVLRVMKATTRLVAPPTLRPVGHAPTPTFTAEKAATPTSALEQVATPTSEGKQVVTSTSEGKQVVTPLSVPKQMATPTSEAEQVATSISISKQVATPISEAEQVATPTSAPEPVATPTSEAEQGATPTSAPEEMVTPTSAPEQVATPTSAPQVATSAEKVTAPASAEKVATPTSEPEQVATSTSEPEQVATSTADKRMSSFETIKKLTNVALSAAASDKSKGCIQSNPRLERLFQRAETDLSALIKVSRVMSSGESLSDVETSEDKEADIAEADQKDTLVTEQPEQTRPPCAAYPRPDPPRNLTRTLNMCANCGHQEPALKTYKMCQKCKEMRVIGTMINTKYYCGKKCQAEDWKKCHKAEHAARRSGGLAK